MRAIIGFIPLAVLWVASVLPVESSQAADPVLVGAGDIASCGHDRDEATARLLDAIPGTVFTTGDNVY
ncbi:MAG TPA: hypothetical protein VNL77_21870, partial [Roseiflexaceae bacterium]|nr:hypothetical protein [Roseiflexaceae bacterium]